MQRDFEELQLAQDNEDNDGRLEEEFRKLQEENERLRDNKAADDTG